MPESRVAGDIFLGGFVQELIRNQYAEWAKECTEIQGWGGRAEKAHTEALMIAFDEFIAPLLSTVEYYGNRKLGEGGTARRALATFKKKVNK